MASVSRERRVLDKEEHERVLESKRKKTAETEKKKLNSKKRKKESEYF